MNIQEVNERVLQFLQKELTESNFKTWCGFIENAYIDNDENIVITVPTEFTKDIIISRYLELFKNTYYVEGLSNNIVITVDKNITGIKSNGYKMASFYRELADRKNSEIVNIQQLIEDTLDDIYSAIDFSSSEGKYSVDLVIEYKVDSNIIKRISEKLQENGFTIECEFVNEDASILTINW